MARPFRLLALLAVLTAALAWTPAGAAAGGGRDHRGGQERVNDAVALGPSPATGTRARPAPSSKPAPSRPAPSDPAAPAHPPASDVLFEGNRVSDFWIDHSAPAAISETADPTGSGARVMKMTVDDGDVFPITPTENPRAELLSPGLIDAGEEIWLQTEFFIPADYPTVPSGGWVSLVSFYGAPFNGPSPWRIELAGERIQWQRNGTYDYDVPWQAPMPRGRWTTVLVHERFAADGFVEMWIDGQRIDFFDSGTYNPSRQTPTSRLEMATMDASNGAGPNSAKIMQYRRQGMFDSGSIYFGPLRLGTTRAAVEA